MDKAMARILAHRIKTGWRTQFTTWGIPLTPQIDGFYSYVGQVKIWGGGGGMITKKIETRRPGVCGAGHDNRARAAG